MELISVSLANPPHPDWRHWEPAAAAYSVTLVDVDFSLVVLTAAADLAAKNPLRVSGMGQYRRLQDQPAFQQEAQATTISGTGSTYKVCGQANYHAVKRLFKNGVHRLTTPIISNIERSDSHEIFLAMSLKSF